MAKAWFLLIILLIGHNIGGHPLSLNEQMLQAGQIIANTDLWQWPDMSFNFSDNSWFEFQAILQNETGLMLA